MLAEFIKIWNINLWIFWNNITKYVDIWITFLVVFNVLFSLVGISSFDFLTNLCLYLSVFFSIMLRILILQVLTRFFVFVDSYFVDSSLSFHWEIFVLPIRSFRNFKILAALLICALISLGFYYFSIKLNSVPCSIIVPSEIKLHLVSVIDIVTVLVLFIFIIIVNRLSSL